MMESPRNGMMTAGRYLNKKLKGGAASNPHIALLSKPANRVMRVLVSDHGTDKMLFNADGSQAWIEVWPRRSERASSFNEAPERRGENPHERTLRFMAHLTCAWNIPALTAMPCTEAAAYALYAADTSKWLRDGLGNMLMEFPNG